MNPNIGPKKVLVIAAHPDDEVLGCGATMARHVRNGDQVHVVICAEGITSRNDVQDASEQLVHLHQAAERANTLLGTHSLRFLQFPDNRLDSVDLLDLVQALEKIIESIRPEVIYTHHAGDVNIDHTLINRAVITATRPIPGQCVSAVYFFEVPSSTEWQSPASGVPFNPNMFIDATDTLGLKLQALACYEGELRSWPHPRSLKAVSHLAHWRGSIVGKDAAESFVVGRILL